MNERTKFFPLNEIFSESSTFDYSYLLLLLGRKKTFVNPNDKSAGGKKCFQWNGMLVMKSKVFLFRSLSAFPKTHSSNSESASIIWHETHERNICYRFAIVPTVSDYCWRFGIAKSPYNWNYDWIARNHINVRGTTMERSFDLNAATSGDPTMLRFADWFVSTCAPFQWSHLTDSAIAVAYVALLWNFIPFNLLLSLKTWNEFLLL